MTAIEIVDYQPRWADEFRDIGARIRQQAGAAALRIDHVGSTAVPHLAAKDVIDVQITVADLDGTLGDALAAAGFVMRSDRMVDHCPPGLKLLPLELEKRMAGAPPGRRRVNIHVRCTGRFNQRYPLLFRDYLRAHPLAAVAYGEVKRALAKQVGEDIEAYYDVKDPCCDIIMAAAEGWAASTAWRPGPSDA